MQHLLSEKGKALIAYVLLLAMPFIVLWPLWLHAEAMAYDMADYFLPVRYFIGECLQQHQFPWWNPYSNLGIPLLADPQSGVFYPVTWLIGYFAGYDFLTINIEYLLHLGIAGCGMFMLLRGLLYPLFVCFILAISYQFSGFFINNAQHLTWIISASWLPYFLHHYRLTFLTGNRNHAIKAALSLFLFTTGGYPAFLIILLYLVGAHFLFMVLMQLWKRQTKELPGIIKRAAVMLIIYLLITSPFIYSFLQGVPLMTRGESLAKDHTLFRAFTPQSAITFLLPAAPLGQHVDFATDTSMTNAYFGLMGFVFLITSLLQVRNRKIIALSILSFMLLLFSFGDALPFWPLLFDYVPYFDHIRFPASFRLFVITGFIFLAAEGMKNENKGQSRIPASIALSSLAAMLLFLLASFFLSDKILLPKSFDTSAMLQFFGESSTLNNILLQSIIQLVLLAFLSVLLLTNRRWKQQKWQLMIALFVFTDLFIASRINFPVIIGSAFPARGLNEKLTTMPSGLPIWDPEKETLVTNIGNGSFAPSYFNNNLFTKKFSRDSYAPFILKLRTTLEKSPDRFALMDRPVIYLTNRLQPYSGTLTGTKEFPAQAAAFAPDHLLTQFKGASADSLVARIKLTSFSSSGFSVNIHSNLEAALILQQTYYPGWKVKVNNSIREISLVNYCMMSVVVPAGDNQVSFFFDTTILEIVLLASSCLSILLLLLIFFDRRHSSRRNHLNLRP